MANANSKRAWAIIPARGGSKGIPGKNIVLVAGKPLLAWTIEAAQAAATIDRVVVSTDDASIAEVARAYGAETIDRPAEISGDLASSEAALLHTLEALSKSSPLPDITVFLQCTSPFTTTDDIDGTVATLTTQNADSAFAACRFHSFLWRQSETGDATEINHDKRVRKMRQEREPEFLEAGSVYAMQTEGFVEAKHRFFGKTVLHEVPAANQWEIDDSEDLEVANALAHARIGKESV